LAINQQDQLNSLLLSVASTEKNLASLEIADSDCSVWDMLLLQGVDP